jgi:DNA invertase Pin-like site-specific DNA recombinase
MTAKLSSPEASEKSTARNSNEIILTRQHEGIAKAEAEGKYKGRTE